MWPHTTNTDDMVLFDFPLSEKHPLNYTTENVNALGSLALKEKQRIQESMQPGSLLPAVPGPNQALLCFYFPFWADAQERNATLTGR